MMKTTNICPSAGVVDTAGHIRTYAMNLCLQLSKGGKHAWTRSPVPTGMRLASVPIALHLLVESELMYLHSNNS